MGNIKCFQCCAEYKVLLDREDPETDVEAEWAKVNEADTWVPVWQQKQVMGQLVMACVALPICISRHMAAKQKTAEELAIEGGRVLSGRASLTNPGGN